MPLRSLGSHGLDDGGPTSAATTPPAALASSRARRKRRRPGAASVHAALLFLLAWGNPRRCRERNGRGGLFAAEALAPPAIPVPRRAGAGRGWLEERRPATTSLGSTAGGAVADDAAARTNRRNPGRGSNAINEPGNGGRVKKSVGRGSGGGISNGKGNGNSSRRSNRNNNNKNNNNHDRNKPKPYVPWDADYATSLRTQRRIRYATSHVASRRDPSATPVATAVAVLRTLLDAGPRRCNAANVVFALTSSAKALGRGRGTGNGNGGGVGGRGGGSGDDASREVLRRSLTRTLAALAFLVDEGKLTPRQLCNAAWGIARHVGRDDELRSSDYGEGGEIAPIPGGGSGVRSTWDLRDRSRGAVPERDDRAAECRARIDDVLDSVAERMTKHLEDRQRFQKPQRGQREVRPGELSMLLWAYAAARPRDRPPGWETPRRVERPAGAGARPSNAGADEADFVTFVELDDSSSSSEGESSAPAEPLDPTSRLFDAAARAFCRGEGAAVARRNDDVAEETTLLRNCTWNELSTIAHSFASRGACASREGEATLSFLAREATRRLDDDGDGGGAPDVLPRDAVQIAWALGTMESDGVDVGDALFRLVDGIRGRWTIDGASSGGSSSLARWTCADLVQMATALAHGRLDDREVLEAVYDESLGRLRTRRTGKHRVRRGFSTSEISILLWVQARMYLTPKLGTVYGEFPRAASRALLERIEADGDADSPGPQEQANLAWSLAVLEDYSPPAVALLREIFRLASDRRASGVPFQLEHAHQLHQSLFILSRDAPSAVAEVSDDFRSYLAERWDAEKGRAKKSSSRHKEISKTLDLMRVRHRNEYDEDVDVAIALDGDEAWTHMGLDDFDEGDGEGRDCDGKARKLRKVAVEFDGPHHFTAVPPLASASTDGEDDAAPLPPPPPPRVLGHTVLKYRLLKRKGWTVVRIPYYEFDKIPFWASMERQRYLQRALKTHEKIEFSEIDVSEYRAMPSTRHSRFD
ncbi:hypothetical protein ACHAWF_004712 [Thalassiosira exigua]